jgi:hypothetical protein
VRNRALEPLMAPRTGGLVAWRLASRRRRMRRYQTSADGKASHARSSRVRRARVCVNVCVYGRGGLAVCGGAGHDRKRGAQPAGTVEPNQSGHCDCHCDCHCELARGGPYQLWPRPLHADASARSCACA